MTATLFSGDEASAPALSNSTPGSLIDILKACLVNGFGSRTAKGGWTIQFEDAPNNKIVFKHPTESIYLRIDDNLDYRWAEAMFYSSMTDIDTGTGQVPAAGDITSKNLIGKRYSTAAEMDNWKLLVHDGGDFIYFWTWQTSYPSGWFFGKITDYNGTTQRWVLTASVDSTSISTSTHPYGLFTTANGHHFAQYNRWNLNKAEQVHYVQPSEVMQQPDPATGKLIFTNWYWRWATSPYNLIGQWPNRIISWGTISAAGWTVHDKITIGGKKYIVMIRSNYHHLFEYDSDSG